MATILSVAGLQNEPAYERCARVLLGVSWLWPKHYTMKLIEHKSMTSYEQWLVKNKPTFGAGATNHAGAAKSPFYFVNGHQYLASFEAVLDYLRPAFAAVLDPALKDAPPQHVNTSGFASCIWFQRATAVAALFAELFPATTTLTVHSKVDRDTFKKWLPTIHARLVKDAFGDDVIDSIKKHVGSPLNWFSTQPGNWELNESKQQQTAGTGSGGSGGGVASLEFIGGCDALCAMFREKYPLPAPPGPKPLFSDAELKLMDDSLRPDEKWGAEQKQYDYDLFVIGGGSGGLACAKEAARLGARVACADYVPPSPAGTTWGLGGTCVNVGCIPKKLMHTAAIIGETINHDAGFYGWESAGSGSGGATHTPHATHNWSKMVENVQKYIKTLNDGYTNQLKSKKVEYFNLMARFVDPHTVSLSDHLNSTKAITKTARRFVIAVGGRPSIPSGLPGVEHAITSDDIFSLKASAAPGPAGVVVIGASYVALECAGFLHGLGYPVSVMVRSVLLRGFDTSCADRIGDFMEEHTPHVNGTKLKPISFLWEMVPVKIEKVGATSDVKSTGAGGDVKSTGTAGAAAGKYRVYYVPANQEKKYDGTKSIADNQSQLGVTVSVVSCDTVLLAIGRQANTHLLNLATGAGVRVDSATGKIPMQYEQTNIKHIYALGDCAISMQPGISPQALELTPVAIQAGKLLSGRLFGGSKLQCEYRNVPTTVFTPIEYGCVGWSEDGAIDQFQKENIEVWHAYFQPLEATLADRLSSEKQQCYMKLITHTTDSDRILGFHVLAPNAGEITQAVAVAIRCRATKHDFDGVIGIHPTIAEQMTTLDVTKGSGASAAKSGC